MAWTAPMTFTSGAALTAAQLNTHLRDNFAETMTGKATTRGSFFVVNGTGPVSLGERLLVTASVTATESTASTSYGDLNTVGPQVTATTGTRAMVWISARLSNGTNSAQCCMTYAVSGATTLGAADSSALIIDGLSTGNRWHNGVFDMITSLNAGSNTFTCKYRAGGLGTAYYTWRRIGVWPL